MLQALTFVPGNEPEVVDMFKRWSIAYSKTLMCHLREEGDVKAELEASLYDVPHLLVALCTAPVMTPWVLVKHSTSLIHGVSAIMPAQSQAYTNLKVLLQRPEAR